MTPSFERLRHLVDNKDIGGRWVSGDTVDELDPDRGAYILAIQLIEHTPIKTQSTEQVVLPPGLYAYAGSARGPGGIRARLRRHFRPQKKPHWHVDQLTTAHCTLEALAVVDGDECQLVDLLLSDAGIRTAIDGFGSTDCVVCQSHLLLVEN